MATTKRKQLEHRITEKLIAMSQTNDLDKIYLLRNLKQLLTELTEDQQKVIILKFLEGYNNQEIADIMDKSIGAIKALQFRALVALKKLVKNGD